MDDVNEYECPYKMELSGQQPCVELSRHGERNSNEIVSLEEEQSRASLVGILDLMEVKRSKDRLNLSQASSQN